MLLVLMAGWVIGAAWRTTKILPKGRLMARMSISALLEITHFQVNLTEEGYLYFKKVICYYENILCITLLLFFIGLDSG